MTNAPRSPSTKSQASLRDTGFPEPFNGERNTTLPHPDANLSPNAVISQEDISGQRVMARTRRSFLQKHKRTISHGVITPQMAALYSSEALTEAEASAILDADAPSNASQFSLPAGGRYSKDGAESFLSHSGGDLSPVMSAQSGGGRRDGLFKKLGWRK
ncbi:hypothetical protein ColTof4_00720 [Colletotrichum tofieldiae]|uniref:Uncharacterized protein n=1 Tax=Colletotrichum tofieldiae TaxID=708197 RepID=A0A161VGD9_9PEZI|nr:hypothetical protein CT0861_06764 [Colletotrichum tofieldiae]GKT60594.1 hypothetical protein ColTof3_07933 [Colletotrichum tofieldiae]GKT68297.1 hypothetical protein ColTof4_00720 [Colletotrichum tofieldiae]GKT90693.1 hypothetical protein Ct61P_08543 [Colletotrichum tofieldiae]